MNASTVDVVAVAHQHAWAVENGRRATSAPAMVALYVLTRQEGRWWVVARQNTATPPPQRGEWVFLVVETRGIEPLTPALQRRCSAN